MAFPEFATLAAIAYWALRTGKLGLKISIKIWCVDWPECKAMWVWKSNGKAASKKLGLLLK